MTLTDKIQSDLKDAMKARDNIRIRTLRMVLSKLKEKKIELNQELTDSQELQVLQKAAKERRESADSYRSNGREDLAAGEEEELNVISGYLPEEMSEEELMEIIRRIVTESGAQSMQDIGKVMGPAMKELAGKADGKAVQACVRKILG